MTPEQKRVLIAAASGFVIGRTVEQIKIIRRRNARIAKMSNRADTDFWKTIEKYLSNPNDPRSVEQMVKDWQTNLEFHKIMRNNKL